VKLANIIECQTIEAANNVDLRYYKFVGLSETRGWCYHIRTQKKQVDLPKMSVGGLE